MNAAISCFGYVFPRTALTAEQIASLHAIKSFVDSENLTDSFIEDWDYPALAVSLDRKDSRKLTEEEEDDIANGEFIFYKADRQPTLLSAAYPNEESFEHECTTYLYLALKHLKNLPCGSFEQTKSFVHHYGVKGILIGCNVPR